MMFHLFETLSVVVTIYPILAHQLRVNLDGTYHTISIPNQVVTPTDSVVHEELRGVANDNEYLSTPTGQSKYEDVTKEETNYNTVGTTEGYTAVHDGSKDLSSFTTTAPLPKVVQSSWFLEKCDQVNKKMISRSINVTLSSILDKAGNVWCKHAETLEIFALDTIHIDADLKSDLGNLTSVILMGHQWHVMGSRIINLKGKPGGPVNRKAEDGNEKDRNGKDGLPGSPGGNGGNFYGYFQALYTVGNSSLVIDVSGGDGGNGQHGGNGKLGVTGMNAQRKDLPSPRGDLSYLPEKRKPFRALIYTSRVYAIHGEPGTIGGNGGNGGAGGLGGHPGIIKFHSLSGVHNGSIRVVAKEGLKGEDGKAGAGALGGKYGEDLTCTWSSFMFFIKFFWKCKPSPASSVVEQLFAESGKTGTTGGNFLGVQMHVPTISSDFASQIPQVNDQYDNFVHDA